MEEMKLRLASYKPPEEDMDLRRFFTEEKLNGMDAVTQHRCKEIVKSYYIMTHIGKIYESYQL